MVAPKQPSERMTFRATLEECRCEARGNQLRFQPTSSFIDLRMRSHKRDPPGPPMDLANMRRHGVRHVIAYCLNDACRHQAIIDVSSYPGDTPVLWFRSKVKCAKCGARGNKIDVRPNWKEAPGTPDDWSGREAMPGGDK
jgi:hypothetical protein